MLHGHAGNDSTTSLSRQLNTDRFESIFLDTEPSVSFWVICTHPSVIRWLFNRRGPNESMSFATHLIIEQIISDLSRLIGPWWASVRYVAWVLVHTKVAGWERCHHCKCQVLDVALSQLPVNMCHLGLSKTWLQVEKLTGLGTMKGLEERTQSMFMPITAEAVHHNQVSPVLHPHVAATHASAFSSWGFQVNNELRGKSSILHSLADALKQPLPSHTSINLRVKWKSKSPWCLSDHTGVAGIST